LTIGTEFAGFLVEADARGEMGIVSRAVNTRRDRREALKVIAPAYAADPSFRARFRREAMNADVRSRSRSGPTSSIHGSA
jgi:serine/threonine protein kinase, bacterial